MHLLPAVLPCTLCLIEHHVLDGCLAAMSLSSSCMLCSPVCCHVLAARCVKGPSSALMLCCSVVSFFQCSRLQMSDQMLCVCFLQGILSIGLSCLHAASAT